MLKSFHCASFACKSLLARLGMELYGNVLTLTKIPCSQDAFKHLERQITDLAMEHFEDSPGALPEKTKRSMLGDLPPSFSKMESSSHLRIAFVEHTISQIVTRRIFEPFLFVLSGRLQPADALFFEMSQDLKRKSTRREALWRQRTLHAAYTASSAKQSINDIARYIVDEIVDAIKELVDRTKWEHVSAAVRRIVKTAAETWRYARLESPLIIASMDSNQIVKASDEGAGGNIEPLGPGKKVLLSLFPIIKREAANGGYENEFKPIDQGYVYSRGRVLYADDAVLRPYQADTRPGQVTTDATSSSTEAYTNKDPNLRKASRPQSPLVPVKLPALTFPQDHHSLSDKRPDTEDTRLINEASRFNGLDHGPTMHPIEQEGASRSLATLSRHSSMTTTASEESARSASKMGSIQDLGSIGASKQYDQNAMGRARTSSLEA